MTKNREDDWEKPRSKGTGLTTEEIGLIRLAYKAGRDYRDIARELKCASRTTSKYYGFFTAEGVQKDKRSIPLRLPERIAGSAIAPPSKSRLMGGR